MTQSAVRYDCSCMQGEAFVTPEGYIRAKAIVTRAGVFSYQNADGTVRKELRIPDEVFHSDALSSMKMIPVTNGHPNEKLVTAKNSKRLAVGFTGDVVEQSGNYVLANLVITDEDAVRAVKEHGRRELSLGYTVDLVPESGHYDGEDYDYKQTNIRYNHLALVDTARAGSAARIHLDEADAVQITGVREMAKRKIKIDAMEYMVEPEIADFFESTREKDENWTEERDRLERNIKNLRDELERVRNELNQQEDELERVRAERDGMKSEDMDKMDKQPKMDAADFSKAVAQRVQLLKTASGYLDAETLSRMDSASDLDIKKEVIRSAKKNISLDGKSDVYAETLFDVIVSERTTSVNTSNVRSGNTTTNIDAADPDQSRKSMIQKLQNAHKDSKIKG